MNKRGVYLPENVWMLVEQLAERLNCSRSSVIRVAILDYAKDLSLLSELLKDQSEPGNALRAHPGELALLGSGAERLKEEDNDA